MDLSLPMCAWTYALCLRIPVTLTHLLSHCRAALFPNSFDAPRVVKAFLTHDLPTLRKHCGPELMERLTGIFNHFEAQVCYMLCYSVFYSV
jgi:hypothetical protein